MAHYVRKSLPHVLEIHTKVFKGRLMQKYFCIKYLCRKGNGKKGVGDRETK